MNKFFYFLAIGLAFTVLQVATVEAVHEGGHMAPPMCDGVPCPTGDDTGVALTIDDPRCIVAPEARDHRCPGFVAP